MALKWLNKIKFCVAVYLLSFSIHAQESDYTSIYIQMLVVLSKWKRIR